MGSLSYGEVAGERMKLGLILHDPEEEHDCFSDNTYVSHLHDAIGVRNVYLGKYTRLDGSVIDGPSLSQLVAERDAALDTELRALLDDTVAKMQVMATRGDTVEKYDQMIAEGNDEGNAVVQAAIDGLIAQTRGIERVVALLNLGDVTIEGSRQPGQSGCGFPVEFSRAFSSRVAQNPRRNPPSRRDRDVLEVRDMHKHFTALLVIILLAGLTHAQDAPVRQDLTPKDFDRVRAVTAPTTDFTTAEKFEQLPAGATTNRKLVNRDIFSLFSGRTSASRRRSSSSSATRLFRKLWVSSPASTEASDGLGPLFNARGCQNCHLKDGRGHPPMGADDDGVSMFLRLSVPPHTDADEGR